MIQYPFLIVILIIQISIILINILIVIIITENFQLRELDIHNCPALTAGSLQAINRSDFLLEYKYKIQKCKKAEMQNSKIQKRQKYKKGKKAKIQNTKIHDTKYKKNSYSHQQIFG